MVRVQDRREGDVFIVEEAIGGLDFRATLARGGELEGGLLAHGIQDLVESLAELDIAGLGLSDLLGRLSGLGGRGFGGAEAGGG